MSCDVGEVAESLENEQSSANLDSSSVPTGVSSSNLGVARESTVMHSVGIFFSMPGIQLFPQNHPTNIHHFSILSLYVNSYSHSLIFI